jgi:hypothetical protein
MTDECGVLQSLKYCIFDRLEVVFPQNIKVLFAKTLRLMLHNVGSSVYKTFGAAWHL